jgi:hypothetical protein
MVKLYPEGAEEARFKISGVQKIYIYCNRDGLFSLDIVKGFDEINRLCLMHKRYFYRNLWRYCKW